jgi:hypothetical protein
MANKPLEIAIREWGNLRSIFERCGDIGDFNSEDLGSSRWFAGQEYGGFIANILEMDKKISQCGYATSEALNVFAELASNAAEKLGLKEELASAFGMGYGFVRTGLVSYDSLEPMQILFHKMFFPFLGRTFHLDFDCDFDHPLVKIKLKFVFERFRSWQNDPMLYTQDFERFQSIGEAWKEWEEINE